MYCSSLDARYCHFVVASPGLHALLHLHRCSFHCEQPSSLGYRTAAREGQWSNYRLANRHSIPCCWSHALDWTQFPRANRFLRQQGLRTCARAPSATHVCARSQRALLCRPSRRRAGCLSLSSAHLTLVNRFHDAHNRIPQQTQTAPNTIRNPLYTRQA